MGANMEPKKSTKPKQKKAPSVFADAQPGHTVIVRTAKGKTSPKPPAGVTVWTMAGDSLSLSPSDMYDRGWVRRKG